MFLFLLLSFFKKGDAIQGAHYSREGHYLSKYGSFKYLKDSKLIEGSYKLDEKSPMLMALTNMLFWPLVLSRQFHFSYFLIYVYS